MNSNRSAAIAVLISAGLLSGASSTPNCNGYSCGASGSGEFRPTQEDLDQLLQSARAQWGIQPAGDVTIKLEDMGNCTIAAPPVGQVGPPTRGVGYTATKPLAFITDDGERKIVGYSFEILINSQCQWSMTPAPKLRMHAWVKAVLPQIVLHEFGHVLTGDDHSADENSIMAEVTDPRGKQVITTADIEKARRVTAERLAGITEVRE